MSPDTPMVLYSLVLRRDGDDGVRAMTICPHFQNPRTHPPSLLTVGLGNGSHSAMQLTLDRMSRIVVPKAIRDRFALKPGDELEISIEADGIRLRPVLPASPLAQEAGILVCSSEVPSSAWDLGTFMEEQRNARSSEIGGL